MIHVFKSWHPCYLKPQYHLWQHTVPEVAEMLIKEYIEKECGNSDLATITLLDTYHADETPEGIAYFRHWVKQVYENDRQSQNQT